MIIINAENLIMGRMAAYAAKKALLGEDVKIINCEKAVITGTKEFLVWEYKRRRAQGTHARGPFMFRMSDKFVRRCVRGMLPYKTFRGKEAYKKIMCYTGVPSEFKDKTYETMEKSNISRLKKAKYMKIGAICKEMGGR